MLTTTLMLWRAMALAAASRPQHRRHDGASVADQEAFERWTERMRTSALTLAPGQRATGGPQLSR